MPITEKNIWKEKDFCRSYRKNVRISTNDIHYGYLSPGECDLLLAGGPAECLDTAFTGVYLRITQKNEYKKNRLLRTHNGGINNLFPFPLN